MKLSGFSIIIILGFALAILIPIIRDIWKRRRDKKTQVKNEQDK